MKLIEISDIVKKSSTLHYRNEYTAKAVFEIDDQKSFSKRIEFIVEMSPIGSKDIRIKFVDAMEYPLVPIVQSLKDEIQILDRKGSLF